VAAVAAAIIELLDDPARAQAMGRAGREWVEQRWTWDRAAADLAGMLAAR
jgi:phosphatidyl-myo-inositol dimannoside synthase